MKPYYITTPIYYITDHPHLGTAYSTTLADVLARFHRSRGEEVFFLTGTDENGPKIARAAESKDLTPRQLVDDLSEEYKKAWRRLDISYDRFIRTTDTDHIRAVEVIFRLLQDRGDVYKGSYEGWYCVSDETFFLEAPGEVCPECHRPLERVVQDTYYFALSRYTDRLLKMYEEHPEFVRPEARLNEVMQFIKAGLRDMPITRANRGWGIPVPGDPDHVLYVWFDALVNYIAAAGFPDDADRFSRVWPAALHIVGKDILVRFHATLWPAMLMGAGIALPRQILAHGWLMLDGEKMSKSRIAQQIAAWRSDTAPLTVPSLRPDELLVSIQREAGIPDDCAWVAVDALRYFLVRDLPAGADAEFSLERLVERYNADLANDLGNLLNRSLSMLQTYCGGAVPPVAAGPLAEVAAQSLAGAQAADHSLQPGEALEHAWKLIRAANGFINDSKPWELNRSGRTADLGAVLYACGEACRVASLLAAPVMPSVANEVLRQLGFPGEAADLLWDKAGWGGWPAASQALAPSPIFPKIEKRKPAAPQDAHLAPPKAKAASAHPATAAVDSATAPDSAIAEITIDDFARVQMRIATITAAEKVEGATRLLKLSLDLGDEQRQILSAIAEYYSPESLVGRQIAVIVNLLPRKMRGIESRGMLLAADVNGRAILLQPDQSVPPGSPVK